MRINYFKLKQNAVFAFTAIVVLLLDQLSKYLVIQKIPVHDSIEIIPNFFYFTHIKNTGAAFGIFQGMINIFIVISIAAVILIVILRSLLKIESYLYHVSLGFILGGAVGNLIDRLIMGEVTDFLHFFFWPVFNLADSFIVIGFIILVIILLKNFSIKEKEKKD
jgi:signal peptidase II